MAQQKNLDLEQTEIIDLAELTAGDVLHIQENDGTHAFRVYSVNQGRKVQVVLHTLEEPVRSKTKYLLPGTQLRIAKRS